MRSLITWLLPFSILLVTGATAGPLPKEPEVFGATGAVRVIDGDTLEFREGSQPRLVRLNGIDAPERSTPAGQAAAKNLADYVNEKPVQCYWFTEDDFGRGLGNCYLLEDPDLSLQDMQLRAGHAVSF